MTDQSPDVSADVDETALSNAIDTLQDADDVVVFTGAGVSTESGIPDFRSPGGVWDKYDPSDFTIQALRRDPVSYWERRLERRNESTIDWDSVTPNPAHESIAALEEQGMLSYVITQNVDGLHQKAGNDPDRVLELHGTRHQSKCLECQQRFSLDILETKLTDKSLPPQCDQCGGLLKRATVSFGEQLPADVLREARMAAESCDVMLAVGSSLTVQPAASLPRTTLQSGGVVIIVNLEPTGLERQDRTIFLKGKAGEVVPAIVDDAL